VTITQSDARASDPSKASQPSRDPNRSELARPKSADCAREQFKKPKQFVVERERPTAWACLESRGPRSILVRETPGPPEDARRQASASSVR